MGNKKNHAKRNKRLANNWRKLIKTRKKKQNKQKLPQKALNMTTFNYENENVIACVNSDSDSNKNILSTVAKQNNISDDMNQTYYVLQKGDPNQHTRIMRANFHQGDERFEIFSRNKQSAAISVVALCFFIVNDNPETWKSANIDSIMMIGDALYHTSYEKGRLDGKIPRTLPLQLADIYPYVTIGLKCLTATEINHIEKNVLNWNNLMESLNRFFIENQNRCSVFTYNMYSFAIMQKCNSFFLLNSNATAYDGEPIDPHDQESAACLMQMFTITCLARHLLAACYQGQMIDYSEDMLNDLSFFYISCVKIDEKDADDIAKGAIANEDRTKENVEQHIGTAHLKRKRKSWKVESMRRSNRIEETKQKKMKVDISFSLETTSADENQPTVEEEIMTENESYAPLLHEEYESESDVHLPDDQNETENNDEETNIPISGRRIVDMAFVLQQSKYLHKHSDTCEAEMVFKKETKLGFRSIFHFQCADCGVFHQVQSSPKNDDYMNINLAATLGFTSIGSGLYHMQEIFSHLNVPCMSSGTFEAAQKKLKENWIELSKHHTNKALLEEIRLAKARGDVDSAGNALISVICDGSWGKRSYGKGFSSLSGCAAIIGVCTKKVLYFGVKNKYCHVCTMSYANFCPPNEHDCNINYVGASSGMETEILVEGFLFCEPFGARFNKLISDGDSSAFKEITERCIYQNPDVEIEKIECINHLFKNARKKLTALCTATSFKNCYRKLLKRSIGDDLCKGIRGAAKHWRDSNLDRLQKLENLEKDCLNAPHHYFGNHDNCDQYFCEKKTTKEGNDKIAELKSCGLFHEIMNYCNCYFANNVTSLLEDQTNNAAEELNSIIAKYLGGKRINYSLGGSYTARVSAAVVQFNSKGHAGSQFHEFFGIIPNNYCLKVENARKNHNLKNEVHRQAKPRKKVVKDKTVKGYKAQKEDLSERALEVAMNIELDKLETNRIDRDMILRNTYGQKHNPKWKEIRKKLINCNYFARIINARGPQSYQKILEEMLYSPVELSNTAEVRHQRLYEPEALKMFGLIHQNYELEKTGIFIDEKLSFLGASPLRLYGPDCIVNVQCPVKAFHKTVDDAILKNLLPLTYKDGDIQIKEKSNWYVEVHYRKKVLLFGNLDGNGIYNKTCGS